MAEHLPAVLVADEEFDLVARVRRALDSMSRRYALMVIAQPTELRRYLRDSCRLNRAPAVIVVNGHGDVGLALVKWVHTQQNAIAKIPIVAVGAALTALSRRGVVGTLEDPPVDTLVDALRVAMRGDGAQP